MSFPMEIPRGSRPLLRFNSPDELQHWLADEESAWGWLSEGAWLEKSMGSTSADGPLAERVMEIQCPALEEIKALASGAVTPEVLQEALTRGYGVEARTLFKSDPGAANIIDAAKMQPAFALGMLAQALNVPVESQSAAAFAGRQAWLNQSTAVLAAAIPERLAVLDKQFNKAQERLAHHETKAATVVLLSELKRARIRNTIWVILLVAFALCWIAAAGYGLSQIHDLTNPRSAESREKCLAAQATVPGQTREGAARQCVATVENAPPWGWMQWSERFALYVFLMTAFTWGMRWLGRMISDAWSAGQSATRRWVALSLVMADSSKRLISDSEKDKDRIRSEVFGDKESESKPVADKEESFSIEQIGKVADLLKKLQEVVGKDKK